MPFAVYILGLTIFTMGTSEFMVAGLIPALTEAFSVSVAEVGYLISLYALGMVFGGPLLSAALLKLNVPHKQALLWLLALYALAQSVATIGGNYETVAIARVVTGITAAACFGVSFAIAADLVGIAARGRAAAILLGGLMLSSVFGVPLATFVDLYFGWRASFGLIAVLTMLCGLIIARTVPTFSQSPAASLGAELAAFKNRHLWAAYTTSALLIGATFAAFSYFAPLLIEVSGFSRSSIPYLLALYGVANVCGNLLVGHIADRYTFPILFCGSIILVVSMSVFAIFADSPIVSLTALITIGLAGLPMNPAMVTRVMRAAHPGPLVNTVHTSAINIGLALGAWLGGASIAAGYGLRAPLWVGVTLAILGMISTLPYLRVTQWRRSEPAPTC